MVTSAFKIAIIKDGCAFVECIHIRRFEFENAVHSVSTTTVFALGQISLAYSV